MEEGHHTSVFGDLTLHLTSEIMKHHASVMYLFYVFKSTLGHIKKKFFPVHIISKLQIPCAGKAEHAFLQNYKTVSSRLHSMVN